MALDVKKDEELTRIIRPLPIAVWQADFSFRFLEESLLRFEEEYGGLQLEPDFQRGHVWTEQQRIKFIEGVLRKTVPEHLLTVQFNCPHWNCLYSEYKGDLPKEIQCIDGLQRITAIRKFLAGELKIFNKFYCHDLNDTSFTMERINYRVKIQIHSFQTKKELIQYYLDINEGGTPHTKEELDRVKKLVNLK